MNTQTPAMPDVTSQSLIIGMVLVFFSGKVSTVNGCRLVGEVMNLFFQLSSANKLFLPLLSQRNRKYKKFSPFQEVLFQSQMKSLFYNFDFENVTHLLYFSRVSEQTLLKQKSIIWRYFNLMGWIFI